jgi:RimJ/RimL family protein N-acetyltransferase
MKDSLTIPSPITLNGRFVRLEPLLPHHAQPLAAAAHGHEELFKWTFVPQGTAGMTEYVEKATKGNDEGTMSAYAIINNSTGKVLGSTRFWNIQFWDWPPTHERFGNQFPNVCEIGHTWLSPDAIRTPVNTEAKLLLLTHAFENWKALRVCFQTDARNERSRAAIQRIGGKFEGIVRAERMASDFTVRDTARFSIVSSEWPEVKANLQLRLDV